MPSRETVRVWLKENEAFSAHYARAHEEYADSVFEEMLEIADDGRNDWIARETKRGTYIALNEEALGRSRLRVDARKWILARLSPKKYGDRIAQEISGPDGGPLQSETIIRTTEEAAEFARMMAEADRELG